MGCGSSQPAADAPEDIKIMPKNYETVNTSVTLRPNDSTNRYYFKADKKALATYAAALNAGQTMIVNPYYDPVAVANASKNADSEAKSSPNNRNSSTSTKTNGNSSKNDSNSNSNANNLGRFDPSRFGDTSAQSGSSSSAPVISTADHNASVMMTLGNIYVEFMSEFNPKPGFVVKTKKVVGQGKVSEMNS